MPWSADYLDIHTLWRTSPQLITKHSLVPLPPYLIYKRWRFAASKLPKESPSGESTLSLTKTGMRNKNLLWRMQSKRHSLLLSPPAPCFNVNSYMFPRLRGWVSFTCTLQESCRTHVWGYNLDDRWLRREKKGGNMRRGGLDSTNPFPDPRPRGNVLISS